MIRSTRSVLTTQCLLYVRYAISKFWLFIARTWITWRKVDRFAI